MAAGMLGVAPPMRAAMQSFAASGDVVALPVLGGLHHWDGKAE